MPETHPEIAVIGGGTGSFALLQELKELTPNVSAIVNMCDDGGSTGVLRDELGVLPPGDVRQCLVALSGNPDVRDLFGYRFAEGRFGGQSLGNIILSGLELQHDSFDKAIRIASSILGITGRVIPVSLDNHTLVMEDGEDVIHGEYEIGHRRINSPNATLYLTPSARINPEAEGAIYEADIVVIAPGSLYGSLLPALAVDGMRQALTDTNAHVVSVTNLVTKPGQTDGWHVVDYVKAFEAYIGQGTIDTVLYNSRAISPDLLEKYAAEDEFPVAITADRFSEIRAVAVGTDLVAEEIATQDPNDTQIRRTLIRHDGARVGQTLLQLA